MGWKIYFCCLTLLLVTLYVLTFAYFLPNSSASMNIAHYLDLPISIVALVGLYGYAFRKRIGHPNLWKVWLVIIVLWDMFYNLVLSGWTHLELVDMVIFLLVYGILFPEYFALYMYGFRSGELWQKTTVHLTTR